MPPKGRTQKNSAQRTFLAAFSKKTGMANRYKEILAEKDREIDALRKAVDRKFEALQQLRALDRQVGAQLPLLKVATRKRRLELPTSDTMSRSAKCRRSNDTYQYALGIHGGTIENDTPALIGLIETLTTKFKCLTLAKQLFDSKQKLVNALNKEASSRNQSSDYESSDANIFRSLSVYYSHDVLGKEKYNKIRSANATKDVPNFVPYSVLSKKIRSIDIGTVRDINPDFTDGLPDDEIGEGCYRPLREYALRLAQYYICVNEHRVDKLKIFQNLVQKEDYSLVFAMCLGGDEAPAAGTSYLVSFYNVGKRIRSSSENFLIFGANVKETSEVVKRYLKNLFEDVKYLEAGVFDVNVNNLYYKVEFSLEGLSNDLKNLVFLAGELPVSAYYFSTFALVNTDDVNNPTKEFGHGDWKPPTYQTRLDVAKQVEDFKKGKGKRIPSRNAVLGKIRDLGSRQEFVPLVLEKIGKAIVDDLHLKNNFVQGQFKKVLFVVVEEAHIPSGVKLFKDLDDGCLLVFLVKFVRYTMKCGTLAKKLMQYFEANPSLRSCKDFTYRFKGRESFLFLQYFTLLIDSLKPLVSKESSVLILYAVYYQTLLLRKLVSYSVRIESITLDDAEEMKKVGRALFKACCLHDFGVTPSEWTFCNVAPVHCKDLLERFGVGLGINSMEGREQKHQAIRRYASKSTYQNRWSSIFRHEHIQGLYLKELGFDKIRYKKRVKQYVPTATVGQCKNCCLLLSTDKCNWCDSEKFKTLQEDCE